MERRRLWNVVDDYMLFKTDRARASMILRVIDADEPPIVIPRLMIAMDLIERGTSREVAAARAILARVL